MTGSSTFVSENIQEPHDVLPHTNSGADELFRHLSDAANYSKVWITANAYL
ncbi:MAG: hypothetical protein GXP35_03840 [Actinobacteria bacterium]|nr:hypothetical protein [Actinomycetota bacterium]